MAGAVIVHHHVRYKTYPGGLTPFVVLACLIASSGGLIFGYDIGISGGVTSMHSFLVKFFPSVYEKQQQQVATSQYCKFDSQLLTLFASSLFLAAMAAAFVAALTTRAFGRKWTMFGGGVTFMAGASISGAAVDFAMLLAGRILLGIGVGLCIHAVPLYLADVAPARQRGMLSILFQLMITVGILAANLVNWWTSRMEGASGWHISLALGTVPAAIVAVGSLAVPDTPSSLIQRGEAEEARAALAKMRGTVDVQEEFDDLVAASEACRAAGRPWTSILERRYRPQLTMAVLIPFFQQLTGINVIMFYAPVLFKSVGFREDASLVSSVITGLVNMFSTFVAIATIDKVGRRALFLQGGTQMIISQILVGTFIGLQFGASGKGAMSEQYAICIVLFVCVYVAGFAWSWGPLGWLVPSEVFPMEVRSAAQTVTVAVNMFFTVVIGQVFLTLLCRMRFGLFYFFGAWGAAMTAFVAVLLPETKNVPVEEMALVWRKHWFWRRFNDGDAGLDARKKIAIELKS